MFSALDNAELWEDTVPTLDEKPNQPETKMNAVAQTILNQLGGNRFVAMTGAKSFVYSSDSLTFRLPSNFAKNGINAVTVTLDPSDTYSVRYMKIRGINLKDVATDEMVYCDKLQSSFTARTGLDTHL